VKFEHRMGQSGCARRGQAKIGQRRRGTSRGRVGQGFAEVGGEPIRFAAAQYGHVDPEFARKCENHAGRDRAVIVLHLIQVGERHAEFLGEDALRQVQVTPDFAKLAAGADLLSFCRAMVEVAATSMFQEPAMRSCRSRCRTARIEITERADVTNMVQISG